MKLKSLAQHVAGQLVGDGALNIKNVALIEEAQAGDLVFVLEQKYLPQALASKASALVAPADAQIAGKAAILVKNPRRAMAKILAQFAPAKPKVGLHKTAIVPKSCAIGKDVSIGPYVVLGENVKIGDQTIIYPQVTIYDNVIIGKRVIIHSGTRIGVDGYGYVQENKMHLKIPQLGNVIVEDDVEIFANVCISRATLGSTLIGAGVKIDNISHVAHNCKIGKNCAIVSLVGFAGSVTLKDNVYVAGQVGFNGHITVGENSVIMARAGVTKDVPANSIVSGFPAQDHHQETKLQATLRQLAKKSK